MNNDTGELTAAELGQAALKSVVKMVVIKWAIIYGITKLAQRAAKKYEEEEPWRARS